MAARGLQRRKYVRDGGYPEGPALPGLGREGLRGLQAGRQVGLEAEGPSQVANDLTSLLPDLLPFPSLGKGAKNGGLSPVWLLLSPISSTRAGKRVS